MKEDDRSHPMVKPANVLVLNGKVVGERARVDEGAQVPETRRPAHDEHDSEQSSSFVWERCRERGASSRCCVKGRVRVPRQSGRVLGNHRPLDPRSNIRSVCRARMWQDPGTPPGGGGDDASCVDPPPAARIRARRRLGRRPLRVPVAPCRPRPLSSPSTKRAASSAVRASATSTNRGERAPTSASSSSG
jgi:hypothetical protein